MADFTFKDVTAAQLVVMGDGFLRVGDVGTARKLYEAALRQPHAGLAERIQIRIGLTVKRDSRLKTTFDVLNSLETQWNRNVFVGDGLATWLKRLPFLEDPRFVGLAGKHSDLLPLRNWHWNLQVALWAVQRAKKIEGDLVELGVFKGHTTLFCADYVEFADWPKRWWLYDTFEGIPDDQLDAGWAGPNTSTYKNTFTFEEVRDRFAHMPNIDVIKGRVPEILVERSPPKIAFLHVDLNNATAEIAALELLFDRVSSGGAILFDDYLWDASEAQHRAEAAWFAARGEQILPLPTGQGLYIKR